MTSKKLIFPPLVLALCVLFSWVPIQLVFPGTLRGADIDFSEDFENGGENGGENGERQWDPGRWTLVNPDNIRVVDSGDPAHGKVLALYPGGPGVYALIKGTENRTGFRVEGELCFPYDLPRDVSHKLGLIYNFNLDGGRPDFGVIALHRHGGAPGEGGNGGVLLVDPHRDGNSSRDLYGDYRCSLTGGDRINPGQWRRFKAEILGPVCHFYLGDMDKPKITFEHHEFDAGAVGFKPGYSGGETWVDNVRVVSIAGLSYRGPGLPAGRRDNPRQLITRWWVMGPFNGRRLGLEADGYQPDKTYPTPQGPRTWKPINTGPRGYVMAGTVGGAFNGLTHTYFYTPLQSTGTGTVTLVFGGPNRLLLWLNGEMAGEIKAWDGEQGHRGESIELELKPGTNHLVVMVRGGRNGGDGFFVAHGAPAEG